jgi:hypothetical protein
MDEVDVRTTDLNNRVLMSATLLTDPEISKMVVKASQTLEAVLASDATFQQVKSLSNAELLAGVVRDNTSPTGFRIVTDRTLQVDGPGIGGPSNIHVAGQLSLASATVVFNNANISSGGVIQVSTRNGVVNRTYGTVVPGAVSFIGANGNRFENTAANLVMNVANNGDISRHITPTTGGGTGMLSEVGSAHSGTVMNVGKVQ